MSWPAHADSRRIRGLLALALVGAALVACGGDSASPPVPAATIEELQDPTTCEGCHPQQHLEWSGSMHAYAAEDPIFRAMNARGQRETNGELGTFCVNCHAPMAVKANATKDGLNLDALPASQRGVTCYFCHAADSVTGTHDAPIDLASDGVMRASISDPVANTAHASTYSTLLDRTQLASATLCGSCHDIVSPLGAHIERTFAEWQDTVFSKVPADLPCGECHMDSSTGLAAMAPGTSPRKIHSHMFPAVDTALIDFPEKAAQLAAIQPFLDTTVQAALCVKAEGGLSQIQLVLDNVGAGHSFPSGASQDRRVWAEIVASAAGAEVYSSGVVPAGQSVTSIDDPDLWLLRDCMSDASGKPVTMFWQAASDAGDQLAGQATLDMLDPRYYATHVVQSYPRATATQIHAAVDHVTAKLHLLPVGIDVLDDLVKSGDLDPSLIGNMQTLDVAGGSLTWTAASATIHYIDGGLPVTCVSTGLTTGANAGTQAPPSACP